MQKRKLCGSLRITAVVFSSWSLHAFGASLEFDVASVRPAAPRTRGEPLAMHGGPGTSELGRISIRAFSLTQLILAAYSINRIQLIFTEPSPQRRYDIEARFPESTSRENFNVMLQSLLVERFGLRFHREAKEFTSYRVIAGKRGAKLQPTKFDVDLDGPRQSRDDPDGVGIIVGSLAMNPSNGSYIMTMGGATMSDFAMGLESLLVEPVVDATGLTGRYDIRVRISTDGIPRYSAGNTATSGVASDPAPDILHALPQQLGIEMEKGKTTLDMFIVDHVDSPTAN